MRCLISILLSLAVYAFIQCTPSNNPRYTAPRSVDTLYISIDYEHLGDTAIQLTDSLTKAYLSASLQGLYYLPLDSVLSYKGYDLGTIALTPNIQGRFIRFVPSYNDYQAVYLFLLHKQPTEPLRAVEVAFSMWEEGVQGTGRSFLIQNGSKPQLYHKQYWINYYGEDAEAVVSTDAIVQYVLSNDTFMVSPMRNAQQQTWRTLFEQKEQQQ